MTRFAKLTIAAAVATLVLISVGGLVRATDSGLGCPDWPGCFAVGDLIPPLELTPGSSIRIAWSPPSSWVR